MHADTEGFVAHRVLTIRHVAFGFFVDERNESARIYRSSNSKMSVCPFFEFSTQTCHAAQEAPSTEGNHEEKKMLISDTIHTPFSSIRRCQDTAAE